MPNLLSAIQDNLESIYEISVSENVHDFLITDKKLARILANKTFHDDSKEQLLISASEEYLDISLYLDKGLIKRLGEKYPSEITNINDLHDFWVALEGVSHFLYLVWNATYDRPVSQLELELQAEVDKFVSALSVIDFEKKSTFMQEIWTTLFSQSRFNENLEKERLQRYQKANMYASQYCLNLMQLQNQSSNYYKELRRFYRLKQNAKISRIDDLNLTDS